MFAAHLRRPKNAIKPVIPETYHQPDALYSQLTGGGHPAEQFDWLQFQNRQHQKSAMKKRNGGREEEVTDCDRILRTSEKKMMRREGERCLA